MNYLGKNIKLLREKLNLTQDELGAAIGITTKGVVSNWEKAKNGVKSEELIKLSEFFSIPVDALLRHDLANFEEVYPSDTIEIDPVNRLIAKAKRHDMTMKDMQDALVILMNKIK